jgi:hypothetical protein
MPRPPRRPLVPVQPDDPPKPTPKPPQDDPYWHAHREPPTDGFIDRMTVDNREQRPVIKHTWVCLDGDGRPTGHAHYDWMGAVGGFPRCPTCGSVTAIQLDVLQPPAVQEE